MTAITRYLVLTFPSTCVHACIHSILERHILFFGTILICFCNSQPCLVKYASPPSLSRNVHTTNKFQHIVSHYTRLLARWPKDALRPEKTFQQIILEPRLQAAPTASPAGVTSEAISSPSPTSSYVRNENNEVNAAYLLLENSFSKQFRPGKRLMEPMSNPKHYENLRRELEELPNRSLWGNWLQRMKSMVRMK